MCWSKIVSTNANAKVSVAGCLGYDVLAINWIPTARAGAFQLLVV